MIRIVGIHGIGNHQPALSSGDAGEMLGRRWSAALRQGLGAEIATDLRVAYYAHHLARGVAQGGDDPEQLSAQEQHMLLSWVHNLGAPAEVAQGRLTAPARRAVDWIARRFGLDTRLVAILVNMFCREVATYFTDAQRRQAARTDVTGQIEDHAPQVVIAHSLGSVVGYEALWSRPDLTVDLLITLGSPLGMPDVVYERLDPGPDNGRGQRPPGVRRWINISDPGDMIAIPRQLTSRFAGIAADIDSSVHVFDFHKVTNYLACAATTAAVASQLNAD